MFRQRTTPFKQYSKINVIRNNNIWRQNRLVISFRVQLDTVFPLKIKPNPKEKKKKNGSPPKLSTVL